MTIIPSDVIALLVSLAVGGLIGTEREIRDKAAGLRTLMFICAGSTLFTIFSMRLAEATEGRADATRIAAQVVSGVGFLGAGAILRERGEVRGLTTAATIWLVAALGVGIGGGWYLFAFAAAIIIVMGLLIFPKLEQVLGRFSQVHKYTVVIENDPDKIKAIAALFLKNRLRIRLPKHSRIDTLVSLSWTVEGSPVGHENVIHHLMNDTEVKEFSYT